jgi:opacity protein-like surface antigen
MMKNRALLLILSGICLIPSTTRANSLYLSGNIGGSDPQDSKYIINGTTLKNAVSYKEGMIYGAAIGIREEGFRVEAAFGHQQNDVDKIFSQAPSSGGNKVSINSYLANGYLELGQDSSIDPYIMCGIGLANIKATSTVPAGYFSANHSVFAWQMGFGAGFKASKHLMVDLGLRYFKPSSYTESSIKVTTSSLNLMTGLQYYF